MRVIGKYLLYIERPKLKTFMSYSHLDLLLAYLYENRGFVFFDEILDGFNKVHTIDTFNLLVLLNKLEHDGYVTRKPIYITTRQGEIIIDKDQKPCFFISFEGVLFVENALIWKNRPYRWKQSKEIAANAWMVLKITMIFLNAVAIIILTYLQATK